MKSYKKLRVYRQAHELVLAVYAATKTFPKQEQFGLVSQMRRCAVSVPANILEGRGRRSDKELRRFLLIANGSLSELEYFLELSCELGYVSESKFEKLEKHREETGKLLGAFVNSLES